MIDHRYGNWLWQTIKVIWHKTASPLQMDGSVVFRQVMPTCPPMWAHWCHLANTIELVLPSAHPSAQPKRQIDRLAVSAQLTAESPYTLQLVTLCPKLPLIIWGSAPPSNSWFLGPVWAHSPNGITVSSAVLAQVTAEYPILYTGPPLLPSKLPLPNGGSGL